MGKARGEKQLQPTLHRAMPAWANGRRNPLPRRHKFRWRSWLVILVGLGIIAYLWLPDAPFSLDGPPLTGSVERVSDGDTIDVAGQRIRLPGIDAPEWNQTCRTAAGGSWDCGKAAATRMRELTRNRTLSCRPEGHDRYGRLLAVCRDGKLDIAEALVADGLAVATDGYLGAESQARRAKRGVWQGQFEMPADWRRREAEGGVAEAGNPSRFERFVAWLWSLLPS
ncbi:thermonuclease family protein [Devosia insulae]|uniref:thermonuclease family protein n=1 Tax=Devosia insulae TaxID=408174 RepID=UPI000A00E82C|nr:thermonuclease family protein [Devosia insulae]